MVKVYNSREESPNCGTKLDAETKDKIINLGVPLELYTRGVVNLGANNSHAIRRLIQIGTTISENDLPMFPSRFMEFVADRTLGRSKQDYRMTLDGEPGTGKSYTSTYYGARYAIEAADRTGGDPLDYFSLDTCALLQDTEGVTKLMDEAPKYACVVIDDAGIAAGNRDFLTASNKNMSAILQTCRTKRWFLLYNMPNRRHVDLQIRELVYAKAYIHSTQHKRGFNIVKINREKINVAESKSGDTWKIRLLHDGHKINYHLAFSTDFLDPYKDLIKKYDELRDQATLDLIHERAEQETERKNPTNTREMTWKGKLEAHYDFVKSECMKGGKVKRSKIMEQTGLTDRDVLKMIALYNQEKKNNG